MAVRNLTVVNVGQFMFDYVWELKCSPQSAPGPVSISPVSGAVGQGEKADCVLSFVSSQPLTLKQCDLSLKVQCCCCCCCCSLLTL